MKFKLKHCEYLKPSEQAVFVTIEDSCGNLFSGCMRLNDVSLGAAE